MFSKILLFGPAAAGKTSLRKFFFEATPADELLRFSEPATIGLNYNRFGYVYRHPMHKRGENPEKFPMKLVVVDAAGQEIDRWLDESKENVFAGTDLIIFMFDVSDWLELDSKERVKEMFKNAYYSILDEAPDAMVYILGHKFDKIKEGRPVKEKMKQDIMAEFTRYINDEFKVEAGLNVFLTSLAKKYRGETFYTMLDITTRLLARPF